MLKQAHHAVASGSDMISDSSCAKMEAMPSAAEPPFGPTRWNSQKLGHLFTLPTNPKLQQQIGSQPGRKTSSQ